MPRIRCIVLCLHLLAIACATIAAGGIWDATAIAAVYQDGSLAGLKAEVAKARAAMEAKKLEEALEATTSSAKQIVALAPMSTGRDRSELQKLYQQISGLQELLAIEGADLEPLPDWKELIAKKPDSSSGTPMPNPNKGDAVVFERDIAPWMVDQCGRCHIQKASGGFSMATVDALMKGAKGAVVLFPGDAVASRIVETIETGDMPRGGGKVTQENLAKLKKWIEQGAKTDGISPQAPLVSIVRSPSANRPNGPDMAPEPDKLLQTAAPTGKETVSFARDIAPILTSNCNGCHYAGMRPMGGLAFNNYSQLLRGGDSGPIVTPGKGADSLLVKKLRGMAGQRMPAGGRPALSEDNIRLVSTWIDEGASFDGESKEARLDSVISQAWASKASHEELMERRVSRAKEKWQVVAPKSLPDEAQDDRFHIIGNIGADGAKRLLGAMKNAEKEVKRLFGVRNKESLIKGGVTVFALKQRYDYSEFGTMLENRSLPAEWSGHWRADVLDAYITVVYDSSEPKILESSLAQQLASLWIGSQEGTPKWFADGAGRQTLAQISGVQDARVKAWMNRLPESMKQMENLKRFLDGGLNDEDSATIGFGIVRFMNDGNRKRQYDALVRALAAGTPFDQAMLKNVGPLEGFLQQVLGRK
jgi:mono/diheme cytochrome c family protein